MIPNNYAEASPRTPEEIASLPSQPDVLVAAEGHGITQIVHFISLPGAVGVLASGAVKSRERLPSEDYLRYVYQPNAQFRRDLPWTGYVNLSIERINDWMFQTSMRWHAADGNPWVILSFDPQILAHQGVVFTTTNNIYPNCKRAEGLAGFSMMFADEVQGWYDTRHNRSGKLPAWPTDRQAEVLYPDELSCQYLQRIDVQVAETADHLAGPLDIFGLDVPVHHAPEAFK